MSEKIVKAVMREYNNCRPIRSISKIVRISKKDVEAIIKKYSKLLPIDPKGKLAEKRMLVEYRKYKDGLLGKLGSASDVRTVEIDPIERDRLEKIMNGV